MPYISDLDATEPDGDVDLGSDLDDELRALKTAIQDSFPNIDGQVVSTVADLYQIIACTSPLQTQLDAHTSNLNAQATFPQVYSGKVAPNASMWRILRTFGWGVNHISDGVYQIVHNLGTSAYATVICPDWSETSLGVIPCCSVKQDSTSFTVQLYWPSSTPPMFVDHGFTFHLATQ